MEEEKKVSEKTKSIMQRANPYSKIREEDDAETEAFAKGELAKFQREQSCLLYTSPSPRDAHESRMPSSA